MKKLLAMGLLSVGLLAGCMDPIAANQDLNAPVQVKMADTWIQSKLLVTVNRPERVGAGQLKVTLQVYNRTGDDIPIDYQYYFTDRNGVKVEDPISTGWERQVIPAHATQGVSFTSLSAAPEDFRVQIRQSK
jgi:uncharacterized protein YcfL